MHKKFIKNAARAAKKSAKNIFDECTNVRVFVSEVHELDSKPEGINLSFNEGCEVLGVEIIEPGESGTVEKITTRESNIRQEAIVGVQVLKVRPCGKKNKKNSSKESSRIHG